MQKLILISESPCVSKTVVGTMLFEKIIDGMKNYTAEKIEAALRAAGFSEVTNDHHPSKPWITVLARK